MVVFSASHRAGQPEETGLLFREGNPRGWSTVLVTALGSWGKPVPRSQCITEKETLEGGLRC
jgi:hypothetical protein